MAGYPAEFCRMIQKSHTSLFGPYKMLDIPKSHFTNRNKWYWLCLILGMKASEVRTCKNKPSKYLQEWEWKLDKIYSHLIMFMFLFDSSLQAKVFWNATEQENRTDWYVCEPVFKAPGSPDGVPPVKVRCRWFYQVHQPSKAWGY